MMLSDSNTSTSVPDTQTLDVVLTAFIAVVNAEFKLDPTESNSIFLFCGRRCDRIKALRRLATLL